MLDLGNSTCHACAIWHCSTTASGSASSICIFDYAQTYADSLAVSAMDAQDHCISVTQALIDPSLNILCMMLQASLVWNRLVVP